MTPDQLHWLGEQQACVLAAVLGELGMPLAVTLAAIDDDTTTFALTAISGPVNLARLRTLVCDVADGLGMYRIDAQPGSDGAVRLTTFRYHARTRLVPALPALRNSTLAETELIAAALLTERHDNVSPAWLAGKLRIGGKASERLLAELREAHMPPT